MSHILVIDDNDLVSALLKEALTQAGYEVSLAADANSGYQAAIEIMPDLILLDVHLPDVLGFELCRVIRNRSELERVPIIMITGSHHTVENKVRGFENGADDYVLKPFEMPELLQRVKTHLKRSQQGQGMTEKPVIPLPAPEIPAPPQALSIAQEAPKEVSPVLPALPVAAALPASAEPSSAVPTPATLPAKEIPAPLSAPSRAPNKHSILHFLTSINAPAPILPVPRFTVFFLISSLVVLFTGLALTAGTPITPVAATFWLLASWSSAVAVLVMSCSIMGLQLTWKEGAFMISLAGVPLLLKLAGGVIVSGAESLSPFYFMAGPALFVEKASFFLKRLDVFELGFLFLIWRLLKNRPGGSTLKAAITTGLLWLTGLAMLGLLSKLFDGSL